MPKLPQVNTREILAALSRAGFVVRRRTGGHVILRRPADGRVAVVPSHHGDLRPGTLSSILRQAGLTVSDFPDLLR